MEAGNGGAGRGGLHRRPGPDGAALACLAILDGVAPEEAVAYVRKQYDQRAVETPRQRRYAKRFQP